MDANLDYQAVQERLRLLLQNELERRLKKRAAYSLRKFAYDLDLSASILSRILSGKVPVSPSTLKKLSLVLRINTSDIRKINYFGKQYRVRHPKKVLYQPLQLEQFSLINQWYYFAILELIKLKNFRSCPDWIAKTLSISPQVAKHALQVLAHEGFVEIEPNKITKITPDLCMLSKTATSQPQIELQRQILTKAIDALENVEFLRRSQSSLTIAMDPRALPEVQNELAKCRDKIDALVANYRGKEQVYHLSLSFYPVTKILSPDLEANREKQG